jgi:pSer/pThr/pTyr-binding forkhead associated (FHA) protein
VEFSSEVPHAGKVEDDTQRIVNRQARPYLANVETVTVSRLVLIKDDGTEASFPLIRDSYTLGRHRNNDIVISDPKASSFHARIDRSPEGFVLVDLKSRNGCWLNGKRVESVLLKTGDEVRLGMARLVYKVDYTSSR